MGHGQPCGKAHARPPSETGGEYAQALNKLTELNSSESDQNCMKTIKHFLLCSIVFTSLPIIADAQSYRLIAIQDGSSNVFEIDPNTGNTNLLFTLPFTTSVLGCFADYNPADGYIYLANSTNDNSTTTVDIYKLDLVNKTAARANQFTGLTGAGASLLSISFTPAGDLYVYCEEPAFQPGNFFKVQWSTGNVTGLGSTGTPTVAGIAYDAARNKLWALDGFLGELMELSPTNASTTIWQGTGFGGSNVRLTPDENILFGNHDVGNHNYKVYSFNATSKVTGNNITIPVDSELSLAVIPGERVNIHKAVYVDFSNLEIGTNYQLQVTTDLLGTWTNYGTAFTATNATMTCSNYWNVENWNQLFFRLAIGP